MAQQFTIDDRDVQALAVLREQLMARRKSLRRTINDAAELVGRHGEFVSMLERGVSPSPKLSSLQLWAAGVDARVQFEFDGFYDVEHDDPEMLWLDGMRNRWGADAQMRLWVVAALRAWRIARSIPMDVVAVGMGVHRHGAYRWEWGSTDPLFARVAGTARLLGTQLTMSLILREDWVE